MNYDVILSPEAEQDILHIKFYIRNILLAPQAYDGIEKALFKTLNDISYNPFMFSCEWVDGIQYRKALVKKYIIIFRVNEYSHTAYIIAVGHSKQNRKNIVKH